MYQKEQTLHSTDLIRSRNKLRIESSYMKTYKQYSFGFGLVLLVMMFVGCGGQKEIKPEKDEAKTGHIISTDVEADQKKISDSIPIQKVALFGEEENDSRYPYKIRFVSGKVIDVRVVDPYSDLPYESLRTVEGGFERLYELSDLSVKEQESILEGSRINPDAWRDGRFLRMLTKPPVVEISDSKTVISYHASIYSNQEDILATQGYALVFNKNGKLLHTLQDKKDGFYDIRLSSDGKYLMQKYGIDYGEDGSGQLDRGFRFYDTDKGEMIFEWELGKDPYIRGFDMIPNTHFLGCYRIENSHYIHYIIDIEKGGLFMKSMDRSRYMNDIEYAKTLFPNFLKSGRLEDSLIDGFKKLEQL